MIVNDENLSEQEIPILKQLQNFQPLRKNQKQMTKYTYRTKNKYMLPVFFSPGQVDCDQILQVKFL